MKLLENNTGDVRHTPSVPVILAPAPASAFFAVREHSPGRLGGGRKPGALGARGSRLDPGARFLLVGAAVLAVADFRLILWHVKVLLCPRRFSKLRRESITPSLGRGFLGVRFRVPSCRKRPPPLGIGLIRDDVVGIPSHSCHVYHVRFGWIPGQSWLGISWFIL